MSGQSVFANLESYWKDDFTPLQDAGKAILTALRDDENAPDADLYRRIGASGNDSHRYFSAAEPLLAAKPTTTTTTTPGSSYANPSSPSPSSLLFPSTPTTATTMTFTSASAGTAARMSAPAVPTNPPPTIGLIHDRSIPLPPYISKTLQSVKSISLMGLLPEAELAWMTVDDQLFIWPYTSQDSREGPSFCSFTVKNGQCVLSVGLAYPKKGVFRPSVQWCLVVTTTEDVIICALASANSSSQALNGGSNISSPIGSNGTNNEIQALPHRSGALRLVPTRYSVPTDGVRMLSVCGTSDGRIFLGGEDGCLYEITYESPIATSSSESRSTHSSMTVDERLDQFYDGENATPPVIEEGEESRYTSWVVSGGKRALSVFGSSSPDSRPRKCRKLNHSVNVSSFASAVLPDFLLKATSFVFGGGKIATGGGSIMKIVADEERSCLYTLGSKGWICAFSLVARGSETSVKLAAVMDTPRTANMYLEAVARSRMTPPQHSASYIGNITFPGDGSAAQKGVGGMDGARSILSLAKSGDGPSQNVLTPISLHVVPRKEDGRATLVAVTRGGLRYYISSLSSNMLASGPPRSSERNGVLAPSGGKLSLLHIRAPPPLNEEGRTQDIASSMESDDLVPVGGFVPRMSVSKMPKVNASFYGMGSMVLAIENNLSLARSQSQCQPEKVGDHIIATAPDLVIRKGNKAPGGVSETLSLPMSSGSSIDNAQVLPGGVVWDIAQTSTSESAVLKLALNSQTPTDTELSVGLVPEFIPASSSASKRNYRSTSSGGTSGTQIIRAPVVGSGSLAATALTVTFNLIPNLLFSRPLLAGIKVQKPLTEIAERAPNTVSKYRISNRHGTAGFSLSAADIPTNKKSGSLTPISPRLNPRLLRPSIAPLNPMATQHLLPSSQIVVMNAGGLQYFHFTTILAAFEDALISAGENVEDDEAVTSFFRSYGHAEGCAMCILLAIGRSSYGIHVNKSLLKNLAGRAAISRAFSPTLTPAVQGSDGLVTNSVSGADPLLPRGYAFKPSALLDGLVRLSSRLTRPIWHKPLVVVTEGRTLLQRWKLEKRLTPAKVELLLDGETLARISDPLHALTELMKDWFQKAIDAVPGASRKQTHMMHIDEDGGQHLYITDALHHQSHLRVNSGVGAGQLAPAEAERIAFLTEERKIHSLFRLLTRSVQLLRLFSLLSRAHRMAGLPEVDWGSLHGLTVAQMVQTRDGQARLEKVLNNLVTSTANFNRGLSTPSSEADNLANELSQQCYLYFSPGARFSYLGFSFANRGLACPPGSALRAELAAKAAECFRKASKQWHNSSLVTGKSLHTKEKGGYESAAHAAHESGSPLAKAASLLVDLGDVECVVDICLTTAANFSPAIPRITSEDEYLAPRTLAWERQLYHKKQELDEQSNTMNGQSNAVSPSSSAVTFGTNVTAKDAVMTCWSLIFYHLNILLQRVETRPMAEIMVSKCAGESDKSFLHAFYKWMLDSHNTSTLLRVKSQLLEEWLSNDPNLLYSYYMNQENYFNAGRISVDRARNNGIELKLMVRTHALTNALNAYSSALQQTEECWSRSESGGRPTFMAFKEDVKVRQSEAQELLDIATLQARVKDAIPRTEEAANTIHVLDSKLLDANALFQIADAWSMNDLCLLIIHSCRENSRETIETLWRKFFCEAILPCSTRSNAIYDFLIQYQEVYSSDRLVHIISDDSSANDLFENGNWVQRLKNKVISLGNELYGSGADFVFPVDFILPELERLRTAFLESAPHQASMVGEGWSLMIVIKVGVPYITVLETFERHVTREEQSGLLGQDDPQRLDQIASTISVLNKWVEMAQKTDGKAFQELSHAVHSGGLVESIGGWKQELGRLNATASCQDLDAIEYQIRDLLGRRPW